MLYPIFGQMSFIIAPVHRLRRENVAKGHLDELRTVVGIVVGQKGVVVGLPDKFLGTGDDRIGVERYGETVDVDIPSKESEIFFPFELVVGYSMHTLLW